MVKPSRWLLWVLFALALGDAVLFLLFSVPDHPGAQRNTGPSVEPDVRQEPITPIPLDLKLDARKVALGQRLFHDPQLSRDNTISCAHCHNLATGGVDGLLHSIGIGGKAGRINTPTVFNSGFNFRQFWDGRAATLEDLVDFPLQHSAEMGQTWPEVIARLGKDAAYRRDFAAVYREGVKPPTVKDALAAFMRSLSTPNSRFDRYLRGDKQALDSSDLAGYDLFKSLGCIVCHQGVNVGGNLYEKLGLVEDYFARRSDMQEVDFGRYNYTGIEEQRYELRVPSLRNVALTAPYFHDASISTLEGAVIIMGKFQLGVELSADEVAGIVRFLNTLTGEYKGEALK